MSLEVIFWWIIAGSGVTMALAWLFYYRQQSRQAGQRLAYLNELGVQAGLAFTSHEKIAYGYMGFDNGAKALLVLQYQRRKPNWFTIYLEAVSECTVQTYYRLQPTMANTYLIDDSVDSIVLQFHYKSGAQPVPVTFYSARVHQPAKLPEWQSKVSSWQQFLSRLLEVQHSDRA